MTTTILIPVFNEEKNLPRLFSALQKVLKQTPDLKIFFIDNASTDKSPLLLKKHASKNISVLQEKKRGFPEPLNKGLDATDNNILILDADTVPDPQWANEMIRGLEKNDIVVGETVSALSEKTEYGQLVSELFRDYSKKTSMAEGHALPWGPACNLGIKRSLIHKIGNFSSAATSAFDIDFCWRAILSGASISYVSNAKVVHWRKTSRLDVLKQFERYGSGEAWLARTYSFLSDGKNSDPLATALDAYQRLRYQSKVSKKLTIALEETSLAFAIGVHSGFTRPLQSCKHKRRLPSHAIGWMNGKNIVAFVPHRGVTTLSGKAIKIWNAYKQGCDGHQLCHVFMDTYGLNHEDAEKEAEEFLQAMSAAD